MPAHFNSKPVLRRLAKARIAVLMGGRGREREISLRSGANVLAALRRVGLRAMKIDPENRRERKFLEAGRIDIAYIALHGTFGEDGVPQGYLDLLGVPYTGSGVFAGALCMKKPFLKRVLLAEGLPTAPYVVIRRGVAAPEISFDGPYFVKPDAEGSSIGVEIAATRDAAWRVATRLARKYEETIIEKKIDGVEITCGIAGRRAEVFPVLELSPRRAFYDFRAKYTPGLTDFHLPARLAPAVREACQALALRVFHLAGCRGVARVDMIVDGARPVILEINTAPGMTDTSDLPAQARAAGYPFEDLVLMVLDAVDM